MTVVWESNVEQAVKNSPTPRLTRLILTTSVGLWLRKVIECNRLHKASFGLIGRRCNHWRKP